MRDNDPRNWLGRSKPALGSGRTTAEQREAAFQRYLEREKESIDRGNPPPPAAAWPIEQRRELWMRRYGSERGSDGLESLSGTTTLGTPVTPDHHAKAIQ